MATLAVVMKGIWQGQQVRNIYYVAGGDALYANAQDIGDAIRAAYNAELIAHMDNALTWYGFDAKELDVVTNPWIEHTFTSGDLVGANADLPLPTTVAALVTWLAFTARPNRKRSYIPGITNGRVQQSGLWTTALVDDLNAFGELLIDLPTTTSLAIAFVIARVNRETGVLVGSNILEAVRASNIPATQRRRRIGVGA